MLQTYIRDILKVFNYDVKKKCLSLSSKKYTIRFKNYKNGYSRKGFRI